MPSSKIQPSTNSLPPTCSCRLVALLRAGLPESPQIPDVDFNLHSMEEINHEKKTKFLGGNIDNNNNNSNNNNDNDNDNNDNSNYYRNM